MNTAENVTPEMKREVEEIMQMVWAAGALRPLHRLLLLSLAIECKPRVAVPLETVCRWLGSSPTLAERIVNDLEDLGLLTVWRAVEGTQRRPRPVAYRINKKRLGEIRRHR